MKIGSIQVKDAGIYVCRTTNEVGSAEVAYEIEIIQRPKFISTETERKEATANKSFILECPIKDMFSLYNATITWLYNLKPIDPNNKHFSTADSKRKLYIDRYVYFKVKCLNYNRKNQSYKTRKNYFSQKISEKPDLSLF